MVKLLRSEKLHLLKRDYSLKSKVLHVLFWPLCSVLFSLLLFPTTLSKENTHILILSTLTVHHDEVREAYVDGYIKFLCIYTHFVNLWD